MVLGVPVEVQGEGKRRTAGTASNGRQSGGGSGGAYGGLTDLIELDDLGMYVVLTFERERLRYEGVQDAAIFELGGDLSTALVYGVSTVGKIQHARENSPQLGDALRRATDSTRTHRALTSSR